MREAITDVERMLTEIEPAVSTAIERVPHDDFPTAALGCSDIIRAANGGLSLTRAAGRDIFFPFTVAVVAHAPSIDTALAFGDIDGKARERELPALTADIPNSARDTLVLIADAEDSISIPKLAGWVWKRTPKHETPYWNILRKYSQRRSAPPQIDTRFG